MNLILKKLKSFSWVPFLVLFYFIFILSGMVGCTRSNDLSSLTGNWMRSDGEYRIEIISVEASGKVFAKYFNPNQIHVSQATAKQEGDIVQLHVTLQDTGYPGCTYDLKMNSEGNQLTGIYFQAAQNQSYEVLFSRK